MKILAAAIGILSFIVLTLVAYLALIQRQLHSINRQLDKRLRENTRQPVSIELLNRELNALSSNINRCLKAEEILRLNGMREEKQFRELIANISHDLRTPLTAIKGYQQLMERGELSQKQREKLKVAQKHADELGGLIEHFFEYSYFLSAEPELHPERINLTNLSAECLAQAVALFEERGLAVHFEDAPPVFATADREMTVRILQNLIRNCTVHAAGDVQVRVAEEAGKAVLRFRNAVKQGERIDTERLFERFYTADRARSGSTGLGLAIVKLLAGQMGGDVGAALQENALEIRVELPACEKTGEA